MAIEPRRWRCHTVEMWSLQNDSMKFESPAAAIGEYQRLIDLLTTSEKSLTSAKHCLATAEAEVWSLRREVLEMDLFLARAQVAAKTHSEPTVAA